MINYSLLIMTKYYNRILRYVTLQCDILEEKMAKYITLQCAESAVFL